MVISVNSQLGLRFDKREVQIDFFTILKEKHENRYKKLDDVIKKIEKFEEEIKLDPLEKELLSEFPLPLPEEYVLDKEDTNEEVKNRIDSIKELDIEKIAFENKSSYYFICESVYKAAELIKINENFTGRTLKDINFGQYTYLMGKNRLVRFVCVVGAIKGIYYDDKNRIVFEWGIEMEEGGYFFEKAYAKEFSTVMQILTFVHLGDIEVKVLEAGRNNGGKKNVDKVTNTSKNTVYVVDSSWNQIIIRTTGFAVRGHFRLQPCGEGHKDRKLMWISAFEKHGYKRRPTGEIVNH